MLTVGVSLLLALSFGTFLSALPFFNFIPAILITAAISGFGPASLATLLSTALIDFYFLPAGGLGIANPLQAERLVFFDGYCLLLSWFLAAYRAELLRIRGEQVRNLELLASAAPAMAWIVDRNRRCIYVNDRWLAFTGRTLTQELGEGWAESMSAEDRPVALSMFQTAFEAREPFRNEYRLRRHDGTYRWIYSYGVPMLMR